MSERYDRGYPQALKRIEELEAKLEKAVEALASIAEKRGRCSVCGKWATGPNGGVLDCNCGGYWEPLEAHHVARAALKELEDKTDE